MNRPIRKSDLSDVLTKYGKKFIETSSLNDSHLRGKIREFIFETLGLTPKLLDLLKFGELNLSSIIFVINF